jgi:hypothetical protein
VAGHHFGECVSVLLVDESLQQGAIGLGFCWTKVFIP